MDNNKVWLDVPYKEKDEAKSLGARWDADKRMWYVQNSKDLLKFKKWINDTVINIKAENPFYIAYGYRKCWKCGNATPVIALCSENYKSLNVDINNKEQWVNETGLVFFQYIKYLSDDIIKIINEMFPFYKNGFSNFIQKKYWSNHCIKCSALQGDNYLHDEYDSIFSPTTREEAEKVTLIEIELHKAIEMSGSYGYSSTNDLIETYSLKINYNDFKKKKG